MCFFTTFFFTPFAFLMFFFCQPQGLSTSLGASQHTLRLLARRTSLSTFPEPSCWPPVQRVVLGVVRRVLKVLVRSGPCPCTHPRSRSQGEGCQCPCRGAGSSLRTALFVSPSAFSRRAVVSYWRKYVHEVLVNRLGGLSLPRKIVVRLTDRPDMTLDVYRGRKTTIQQQYCTLSSL